MVDGAHGDGFRGAPRTADAGVVVPRADHHHDARVDGGVDLLGEEVAVAVAADVAAAQAHIDHLGVVRDGPLDAGDDVGGEAAGLAAHLAREDTPIGGDAFGRVGAWVAKVVADLVDAVAGDDAGDVGTMAGPVLARPPGEVRGEDDAVGQLGVVGLDAGVQDRHTDTRAGEGWPHLVRADVCVGGQIMDLEQLVHQSLAALDELPAERRGTDEAGSGAQPMGDGAALRLEGVDATLGPRQGDDPERCVIGRRRRGLRRDGDGCSLTTGVDGYGNELSWAYVCGRPHGGGRGRPDSELRGAGRGVARSVG